MAFSGALTLTDLNDFITPSQACIKPVEEVKAPQEFFEQGAASTQIHIDSSGSYYEVATYAGKNTESAAPANPVRKLETAQISLNDCLACSGCITSAESVLITLQSHEEVLNVLASNPPVSSPQHRIAVLSVAPQSLASLAASVSSSSSTQVTIREIFQRVQTYARELGFDYVYDTTFARHISLLEHAREFRERQAAPARVPEHLAGKCEKTPGGCGIREGVNGHVHISPTCEIPSKGSNDTPQSANGHVKPDGLGKLPMLASACPGWVCYAEKTHAEMLPFLSRTKSPQQVMGTLVKQWLAPKWGKKPNEVYHVTVMPCYDKKLEASRPDFYDDVHATRDVDCVITTGELDRMMRERGWDLSRPGPGPVPAKRIDDPSNLRLAANEARLQDEGDEYEHDGNRRMSDDAEPELKPVSALELEIDIKNGNENGDWDGNTDGPGPELPSFLSHPGTSSGSYLHSLLASYTASTSDALVLTTRTLRSADYEEYILTDTRTGRVAFRGARCYGFRNLQNLVRRVGREAGVQVGRGAAGRLAGGVRARGAAARVVRARKAKDGSSAGVGATTQPAEEEERGYDYVEVMACPSGCVNGGGQLRPPSTSTSTADIAQSSSSLTASTPTPEVKDENENEGSTMQNAARWGDKAWVKKVEAAYWHDPLPTPPASPPKVNDALLPSSPSSSRPRAQHVNAPMSPGQSQQSKPVYSDYPDADTLALRVLTELCHPHSNSHPQPQSWFDPLDARAEASRCRFFRTEFHAVEGEVAGIQVKW